jgi:hypothetical protein
MSTKQTRTTGKTKKVVKVTVKRKATKKAVTEVFSTQPQEAAVVEVPKNAVLLYINGSDKGQVETTGQKLADFAVAQAQRYGIRTFSVYIDGRKADTSEADKSLATVKKLEIVAKDSRG